MLSFKYTIAKSNVDASAPTTSAKATSSESFAHWRSAPAACRPAEPCTPATPQSVPRTLTSLVSSCCPVNQPLLFSSSWGPPNKHKSCFIRFLAYFPFLPFIPFPCCRENPPSVQEVPDSVMVLVLFWIYCPRMRQLGLSFRSFFLSSQGTGITRMSHHVWLRMYFSLLASIPCCSFDAVLRLLMLRCVAVCIWISHLGVFQTRWVCSCGFSHCFWEVCVAITRLFQC